MLNVHSKSLDQHSVRGFEHKPNPQHAVVDKKDHFPPVDQDHLASAVEARRYEALWNDSEKNMMDKNEDLDTTWARLLKHLGSELEVTKYIDWVLSHPLKPATYILESHEVAKHLEKANWFEGNSSLCRLNSILLESITSIKGLPEDLNRRFNGAQLGFQVYARPNYRLRTDVEEYEDYFVN